MKILVPGSRFGVIGMFYAAGISPEAFQVIKLPVFFVKDMDYEVYIVHQGPLIALFGMVGALTAGVPYLLFNMVGYGLDLNVGLGFAQDKEIGNGFINPAQIQRHDGCAFLFMDGIHHSFKELAVSCQSVFRLLSSLQCSNNVLQMYEVYLSVG